METCHRQSVPYPAHIIETYAMRLIYTPAITGIGCTHRAAAFAIAWACDSFLKLGYPKTGFLDTVIFIAAFKRDALMEGY